MIFIKVYGNKVVLGGPEATAEMRQNGWFEYRGGIPNCTQEFMIWNGNSIEEDVEARLKSELSILRSTRDRLLSESDWIVSKYAEIGQAIPDDWRLYRQTLRDITIDYTTPQNLVWPDKPESKYSLVPGTNPLLHIVSIVPNDIKPIQKTPEEPTE